MAIYRVRGPDGAIYRIEGPDDATPEQIEAFASAQFGARKIAAAPTEQPESGFVPATKAGIAGLKADVAGLLGRTGIIDIPTAEKYRQEQEEYQRKVFKPTEAGWTEAPVTKVAELLGGSLPYMAAPLAAGLGAAALPLSGAAATAAGLGAAGLTSAAQFTGSNISRQVEEGKRLAETELGSAAAAAVPQAALDLVSFRMMPGIRRIFMQAGKDVPEAAAKKIAEQKVAEIAKDYALATGKTMGTEGLTEAGQQVFERLQAGLNITDPAARDEYFESFIGGAILGGAISPAGRFIERGSQQRKEEAQDRLKELERLQKEAEARDSERAAELGAPLLTSEEAERPLFVDEKGKPAAYTDLQERERQLQEREQAKKDAQEQYTEITKTINQLRERGQTASIDEAVNLGIEAQRLEKLKEDLEKRASDKKDPLYKTKLSPFTQLTQEDADKKLTSYDAIQAKIKQAQGQFDKAKDQGDVVAQGKAAQKLKDLQEQLSAETPDLFGIESTQRIKAEKAAEAKETKTKEDILKEREKVAEAKPAKDVFYELMSQKADEERFDEKQREVEQRQGKALERLEFGLNRMGLVTLGIKDKERAETEVDLGKGIISPKMAKKLGIYTDQYNTLVDRLDKVKSAGEKAQIQEQLDALEAKLAEPVRAVDVLDGIETAYEEASAKQREIVNAIAADQFSLFTPEGTLTRQGKEAATNEVILKQLTELRRLGRESKETLESQAAEDRFGKAFEEQQVAKEKAEAERGEKVMGITGREAAGIEEGGEKAAPYTSRNEAFLELTDAAYKLQSGEFLGRRTGLTIPEAERKREENLDKKIAKVEDDLKFLRGQQTRGGRQQSEAIQRRIADLTGRLKKLKRGKKETKAEKATTRNLLIDKANKAAGFLINNAINEIKAYRLAKGYGEMPRDDEIRLRIDLKTEFDRFINRVSVAERETGEKEEKPFFVEVPVMENGKQVGTKKEVRYRLAPKKPSEERRPYEKLGVALNSLRGELEAAVQEAKGLPTRGEVEETTVEKGVAPDVKAKIIRGKSKVEKIADSIKKIDDKLAQIKPEETSADYISSLKQQEQIIKNKISAVNTLLNVKEVKDFPDLFADDPVVSLYADPDYMASLEEQLQGVRGALTGEKTKAAAISDLTKKRESLVAKRDQTIKAAAEKREADNQKAKDAASIVANYKAELKTVDAQIAAVKKDLAATDTTAMSQALKKALAKQLQSFETRKQELQEALSVAEPLAKQYKVSDRERSEAIDSGKQAISDIQKKIVGLVDDLRKAGVAMRTVRKTGTEAEILEAQNAMEAMRKELAELRAQNAELADALRVLGVETGRKFSPGFILDSIIAEKEKNMDQPVSDPRDVEETLQKIRENQKKLNELLEERRLFDDRMQQAAEPLIRKWQMFASLPSNRFNIESRRMLADKILEYGTRVKEQSFNDLITDTEKLLRTLAGKTHTGKAIGEKAESRFSPYEISLAADFLKSRIDGILKRVRDPADIKRDFEDARKTRIQLGLGLPGVRVEFQRGVGYSWRKDQMVTRERVVVEPKPKAQYKAEVAAMDSKIADAEAARKVIADRLRAEGKAVRGDKEWQSAHGEVMNLKRQKAKISDLQERFIPAIVKTQIFADPDAVNKIADKEARATVQYVQDKPLDEAEVVQGMVDLLKDEVVKAEQALAAVDSKNPTAMKAAQAALKSAQNKLANGVAYKVRADLTPEEIEKTVKEAKENTYTPKRIKRNKQGKLVEAKRKVGERGVYEEDISYGVMSDADIIDSIDYKDDTIDPAIGEEATELIDVDAANKRLEEVKKKAKAQGIDFEPYPTIAHLPIGILKQMALQGLDPMASRIRGGVYKGKVFVIVQNHNNMADLEKTLAHELVGHYTVEGILGREGMVKLLRRIEQAYGTDKENGLDALAKELGVSDEVTGTFFNIVRYYNKAFQDGAITSEQIRENAKLKALGELIAYTTEKVATGIPKSRAAAFKQWVKDLLKMLRVRLGELGFMFAAAKFDTNELYAIIRGAQRHFEAGKPLAHRNSDGTISFAGAVPTTPSTGLGAMVAKRGGTLDTVKANLLGLNFRTQFVDRLAALDALIKRGVSKGVISSLKAMDVMYFSRMAEQRNNFMSQFATSGVGKIERVQGELKYVGGKGPSLKDVSLVLSQSGIPAKEVENEFTQYEIALRAKEVGVDKLDFTKKKVTQKDVDATIAKYSGKDPASLAFQKAHKLYQQYNRDMIDFVVSTGAMTPKLGAELKSKNYVPFYRNRGGVAELVVFGEQPIRIGDMKNQPYLEQLVGGETEILPIFTGALQNTQLLLDMALKNMATRNTAFVLGEMGLLDVSEKAAAKGVMGIHKGTGPADPNVIRFKLDGEDMWARVNTKMKEDLFGDIPTELVVKGMEGIKATIPVGIRVLGMPATWLRKFVTRDPRYAIRQIFRDSMSAVMTTGADFVPVAQTLKDMMNMKKSGTLEKLRGSGILGGQVITGTEDDMSTILTQLASGKPGWEMAMAKLDEWAMMGDAATRVSMYNSFIKQGLSEREAEFATLEAMNFSRRGLSPTILYANTLIPFFNASVQGLDVLYRAATGDMVASERLKVRNKMFMRMGMMAVMTWAYAAMMEDDETYENANPNERYSNWFVPTPMGTFRVPIPFELGLIAKALPEGLYRMAATDDENKEVLTALKDLAFRSVPGDLPTAVKPAVELMLNRSFFTGREIVDQSMSEIAKYQYRPNTPETIKLFGEIGISPAKIEHLVKGYTGTLPIGIIGAIENVTGIKSINAPKATMRVPETPIVGGLFQAPDASGRINQAYEIVMRAQKAQQTYNRLAETDPDEAEEFLKENIRDIELGSDAGAFRQEMGEITRYERFIRESKTMTPEQKREELDAMRKLKIDMSKQFTALAKQIGRQAAR